MKWRLSLKYCLNLGPLNHPLDTPILVRIAERAQLASEFQPREAVAPLRVHVSLDERRESCDVLVRELMSLSREFVHRSLQIARSAERARSRLASRRRQSM